MINWLYRLFHPNSLLGPQVHAWSYGPYGRSRVIGEVVEEKGWELVIDPSRPEIQEYHAFVTVWKHDARPLGQDLPIDMSYVGEGV